jgi:hypothetical protein
MSTFPHYYAGNRRLSLLIPAHKIEWSDVWVRPQFGDYRFPGGVPVRHGDTATIELLPVLWSLRRLQRVMLHIGYNGERWLLEIQ